MLACWLSLLVLCELALSAPQVQLGATTVVGRAIPGQHGVEFFGRLPYAEAPIGARRFAPPELKQKLNANTLNATRYGDSCIQNPSRVSTKTRDGTTVSESEDCLFVNVIRPANMSTDAKLPVMFYIHGGAFMAGTAALYDGAEMVLHSIERGTPVVFVNVNYRLGPLGFPVGEEVERRHAENLGVKDVHVALEWVKANIGAFGGDESKVTAFGESAGACILSILYLNPGLEDLIWAGMLESGAPTTEPAMHASALEREWQNFVAGVPECQAAPKDDTFECLRQAPAATITEAASQAYKIGPELVPFFPVIDGSGGVYPDMPHRLYEQRHFANIPFIAGNNKDEGISSTPTTVNSSADLFTRLVRGMALLSYPGGVQEAVAGKVMELYPDVPSLGAPYGTGNETFGLAPEYKQLAAILGDIMFHAPRRAWVQGLNNGGVKSYGYHFTDAQPHLPGRFGTPHAYELPYLFPSFIIPGSLPRTPEQLRLGSDMMDYWISFATTRDPNDKFGNVNRPHWPEYTPGNQVMLQINSKNMTTIYDNYRQEGIDYLINEPIRLSQHPDHA